MSECLCLDCEEFIPADNLLKPQWWLSLPREQQTALAVDEMACPGCLSGDALWTKEDLERVRERA